MLKERNQLQIQNKLQLEMEKANLDAMIITHPESIFYCTGFASHFLYDSQRIGTTLALIPRQGTCTLILNEIEAQTATNQCRDVKLETYPVWIYIDGIEGNDSPKPSQPDINKPFAIATEIILSQFGPNARIGMQTESIPHGIWDYLTTRANQIVDCAKVLADARAIKTQWEIDLLRRTARLTEKAMLKTAKAIVPGMSEMEILATYRSAVFAGDPDALAGYVVSAIGKNYSIVQLPRDIRVEENDVIRLDGGANLWGYQADIARTFVIGQPNDHVTRIFNALYTAFDKVRSMIGPGVAFRDAFEAGQSTVRSMGFPRYSRGHVGHSVGCNIFVEERPFIAAEDGVFLPGMVMSVEVPFYSAQYGGFNIEDTVLITDQGCEWFTHVNDSLLWPR